MNLSRNAKRSSVETSIQEDTFPAAEKILSDIENVIKKDPELTSFEIIPIQDSENKSPVYHEEHSLGLASWCVQPLYCYAYGRLLDSRRSEHRREQASTVSRWLMGALLLNPDVTSFWNMKRDLVRTGRLEALGELRFAAMVLFHKAKCFEAFAYRRWLLQHLLTGGENSDRQTESLLRNEIEIARVSADRYANNYHAWSHREHVVSGCEKTLPECYERLLRSEWESSGKWCSRHVSDHSGLAYRQFLLNRLLREESAGENSRRLVSPDRLAERRRLLSQTIAPHDEESGRRLDCQDSWQFLNAVHSANLPRRPQVDYDRLLIALSYWAEDCKSNENDILSFPGHEALWYHRRFLGHTLGRLQDSYQRHCRYEFEDVPPHPRGSTDSGATGTAARRRSALLTLAFRRDNERIVRVSRNSKHEHQLKLGEKFVKYIREFGSFDGPNDEER